jgi:hypothetical protein
MKIWEKFIENHPETTHLIEVYIEIRKLLQELGHTEESSKKINSGPPKLFRLKDIFEERVENLWEQISAYGFKVEENEFLVYLRNKFANIDTLIPLKNGDNERDDTGN